MDFGATTRRAGETLPDTRRFILVRSGCIGLSGGSLIPHAGYRFSSTSHPTQMPEESTWHGTVARTGRAPAIYPSRPP